MAYEASVHAKALQLIRLAVEMTTAAQSGHPTSAASLAHLVTVLMYDHMRYRPSDPADPRADRLVLSEGHACPIVYAAAADLGMAIGRDPTQRRPMTRDDALQLREIQCPIDGHPNPAEGFPFFPAATGSLGQGLSIAAGLALAARLDGLDRRVFCLIGDGESREGQIAEALDFLIDYQLRAVCPIFNCNHYGQSDAVSSQQSPEVIARKLEADGFQVRTIDGHDPDQIRAALDMHTQVALDPNARPLAIVARTTKGWGMTAVLAPNMHGRAIPEAELPQVFAALDAEGQRLGATWTPGDLTIPPLPEVALPAVHTRSVGTFGEALKQLGQGHLLDQGKLAPRRAYGIALAALGHADPRVVALDGDVRNSTFSEMFYKDPQLHERFFECKIAEQNMISVAGGLAAGGKIPFAASFGKFLVRGYDQLEMGLISRFPLKLVGSHTGISLASDGPSQMALADVAFCRAWGIAHDHAGRPALYVLNPSDAYSAYALTLLMAESPVACYLRAFRPDVPFLYDERTPFALGGHRVLQEGGDLVVFASGYLVHEAKRALEQLQGQGVHATLVDLYSLPFDAAAIVDLAAQCGGRVLTVEDNFGAAFGSAVAETLATAGLPCVVRQMFVQRIPKSGRSPEDLLEYTGLSAPHIVERAAGLLQTA